MTKLLTFLVCIFVAILCGYPVSAEPKFKTTFLGTSSLLIETDEASVLFDGYFSRHSLHKFLRMEPDLPRVLAGLDALGVATTGVDRSVYVPASCSVKKLNKLDAVVPFHGHFDHALDAPLVSGLTGAKLVGGPAIKNIFEATKKSGHISKEQWAKVMFVDVPADKGKFLKHELKFGDIEIRLFEAPHSKNVGSWLLDLKKPAPDWNFATSAFRLPKGLSMGALVQVDDYKMLIVPTAGDLGNRVSELDLSANVIFLGIGGLQFKNKNTISKLFNNSLVASGATKVYPIHWDDFTTPIDPCNPQLKSENSKVQSVFEDLAMKGAGFEVNYPSAFEAFNPFRKN